MNGSPKGLLHALTKVTKALLALMALRQLGLFQIKTAILTLKEILPLQWKGLKKRLVHKVP